MLRLLEQILTLLETENPIAAIQVLYQTTAGSSGLTSLVGITGTADIGVEHFLPKPYSGSALLEALQTVLTPEAPRPASPRPEP